jgi:type VI secretion system protein ImpK
MSDNPFSEPEDTDRTIIRVPGGAAPPPPRTGGMPTAAAATSAPPAAAMAPRLAGEAEALPKVGISPVAAAAAPLLDLLARIGAGPEASQVGDAEGLRDRAVRALQAFEVQCKADEIADDQIRAAHYALCAAIDDVALATPWGQSSSWATRSLSSTFHQDVRSGERFFDLLDGMQKDPGRYRAALEICYLCLALGFRGRYRLDSRGSAELDRKREGLYQLLAQLRGSWERELSPHWRGVDAPHRGPGRSVPAWVAGALALAVLAFGYIFVANSVNSAGDDLQQRLAQLPPQMLPVIERSTAPVAAAAAPATGPDLVATVTQFLQPEIREGLVVVQGDAQRLLIRIKGRGMFASGSADLEPRFIGLLQRIGEALKAEPGQVMVLGHSDNQPIRTVRFPSNFQLSAARAESAKIVLVTATGQPARFASAGRADNEPLMSNATPEGREENRRIEVVLSRSEGSR